MIEHDDQDESRADLVGHRAVRARILGRGDLARVEVGLVIYQDRSWDVIKAVLIVGSALALTMLIVWVVTL